MKNYIQKKNQGLSVRILYKHNLHLIAEFQLLVRDNLGDGLMDHRHRYCGSQEGALFDPLYVAGEIS